MYRVLFFLWVLLSAPVLLEAQDTTLIPRDHFFRQKGMAEIRLSRNGQRVYYLRPDLGRGKLLYRDAESPQSEKTISFSGTILDWAPTHSDKLLLFLSDYQGHRRLMLAGGEGGIEKDLTPFSLKSLRIDALSRLLPDKAACWITGEEPGKDGIYTIDLKTANIDRFDPQTGFEQRFYDGELRLMAGVRSYTNGSQAVFFRKSTGWQELASFPFEGEQPPRSINRVLSVSEDGKRIYLTDNRNRDKAVLLEIQPDSAVQRILVADAKTDILPFGALIGADGWPQMVQGWWASPRRYYLHRDSRLDMEWLNGQWNSPAMITDLSADGRTWLVGRSDGGPVKYYLLRRTRRQLIPLFTDYGHLPESSLAQRRAYTVRTRDGAELPVQIYLPPGADQDRNGIPDTLLPSVLYVHEGPWAAAGFWNDWSHTRHFQLLTNRGYAVIVAEFRGANSLGRDVRRSGERQWGEMINRDLVDVADWATRTGIADPQRTAILGWDFGGYAASAALASVPERFACGLSMHGPSDLESWLRLPFANSDFWRLAVGESQTPAGALALRRQSPYHHIDRIVKPLLLVAGAKDDRVPKAQMDVFAKALNDAGRKVVYFYYSEEGHSLEKPENWISFWAIAERFLHDHLGGRFQPAGDDLKKGGFSLIYGKEYLE